MPISGATRHDATVAVSENTDIGVHHVVKLANISGSGATTLNQHPRVDESYVLKAGLGARTPMKIYGVAVTKYLKQDKAPSTYNPVCVVAVSGPVTVEVEYATSSPGSRQKSKTELAREYLGNRGLVLQDTMNTTNGVDVILYDSRALINSLFA